MESGFDALLATLAELGADGLPLPGLDEPMQPATYVRVVLAGGRDEGWDFDRAWSAAINRLQPTPSSGVFSLDDTRELREDRAMLEASREIYRAAYEDRRRTASEAATFHARIWKLEEQRRKPQAADEAA